MVIIATGKNEAPAYEINQRIEALGKGWKVISANTTLVPFGEMDPDSARVLNVAPGSAVHVYYATTVVMQRM